MILAWVGFEVPAIGFFHPVNALLIFIVLLWIVNEHLAKWTNARASKRGAPGAPRS